MTRLDRSAATVLRLCQLAQLPRATYYRSLEAKAPRAADMEMRSLIHAVSLANRHYGYRRITHALRRQGVAVNGKRVQRLMREDNLIAQRRKPFIPPPADSCLKPLPISRSSSMRSRARWWDGRSSHR